MRNAQASLPVYNNEGLGPKKTIFVVITVIGCVAILWPKVFHPMMFGTTPPKVPQKDHRGSGCCDVVLDREKFMNATPVEIGPQMYRKRLNLLTGELSLRQERPPHLRPESIHLAMRERGRAIPNTQTVPIVDRPKSSANPPPRIVEGRPGPIPGMRPPMGAGSVHQAQPKGSGMGFIMPLYTVGIIVFFVYTIMKLMFKKNVPNAPYGPVKPDPEFRKEVFGKEGKTDEKGPTLVVTAIQGLIDAADEQLKLREKNSTTTLSKEENNVPSSQNGNLSNGHTRTSTSGVEAITEINYKTGRKTLILHQRKSDGDGSDERKKREGSADRSVTVLGMELTTSCEGGRKWGGRPPTPVFLSHPEHSATGDDIKDIPEPQSIFLEGSLPHESQILVSDSETLTEELNDDDLYGSDEPAFVLSSKMTLSLINLPAHDEISGAQGMATSDIESPLADDIEIIGDEAKDIEN